MKKAVFIFLAFCLLLPGIISAQETETQDNAVVTNLGLYGGQPEDICIDYGSDNVYIAVYSPNGLFYSNDAGVTWHGLDSSLNLGVGKAVEVDQDTGVVYALIGDELLKSDNNGQDWLNLSSNVPNRNFGNALAYEDGLLLVGLNNGTIITSTDSSSTFSGPYTVESNSTITSLVASPTANTFYAIVENGSDVDTLYISTDSGATWTTMDINNHGVVSGTPLSVVSVDPKNANHIVFSSGVGEYPAYQTVDGGTTWTSLTNGSNNVSGNQITFDSVDRMYIGSLYTQDPMANPIVWTQLDSITPLSSAYFDHLAVDMQNTNVLYVNTGLGLAKSTDRGVSFTDQVDGITAVKIYAISQSSDKATTWVGANGGLARSTDFTSSEPTWVYPILPNQSASNWMAVWVSPDDADLVVATASSYIYYTENGNDASPTWTVATTTDFGGGSIRQMISDPNDNTILYAAVYNDDLSDTDTGRVFKSTDSGETWIDLEITDNAPAGCLTMNTDGELFVGLTGDVSRLGVYKMATDGTWSRPSSDLNDYEITSILADPADPAILYTTAEEYPSGGGFFKSEDSGETWTEVEGDLDNVNHLDSLAVQTSTNPDTLYVSGQGEALNGVIYKSSDAGETWSLLYTGLKQESFYTLLYDGLVAGNDRGLYSLKSLASLKVKSSKSRVNKAEKFTLTITLKDKATAKKLTSKKVTVYRKISGHLRIWKRIKTNNKGKIVLHTHIHKATRYKAKWKPNGNAAEEYTKVISSYKLVRIK